MLKPTHLVTLITVVQAEDGSEHNGQSEHLASREYAQRRGQYLRHVQRTALGSWQDT